MREYIPTDAEKPALAGHKGDTTMDEDIDTHDDSGAALLRSMEDGAFVNALGHEVRRAIVALKGTVTVNLTLTHDPRGLTVIGAGNAPSCGSS